MLEYYRSRRLAAEFIGTAGLPATVVGSGILAECLSDGNMALALLGNTLPTGAILVVLIVAFGPISGAHSSDRPNCGKPGPRNSSFRMKLLAS